MKRLLLAVIVIAMLVTGCGGQAGTGAGSSTEGVTTAADVTTADAATDTGAASIAQTTGATTAPVQTKEIRLMAIGDNLVHPNIYDYADAAVGGGGDGTYDFGVFFENIRPFIDEADLRFINQETISGGDELGLSGWPTFNSPRVLIHQIEELGFNLANIANNHVLDTGIRGVYHALYNWAKTDVTVAGAYADEVDRNTIRVREVDGVRFALLSFTSHTNGIAADEPWRIPYMEEEAVRRDVAAAKQVADFVIVSAHWGWDDIFNIDDFQRTYANLFAECGVDLVIGTGPHLLQHIEWIERPDHDTPMLCAFSLGNYLSGMIGPYNELSGLLRVVFRVEGDRKWVDEVEMVPLVMHKELNGPMGVYLLSDYTDEMAARSLVNVYEGGLTIPYFHKILKEQIAPEFLPEQFR